MPLLDFVPRGVTRLILHLGTNDLATASVRTALSDYPSRHHERVYATLVLPLMANRRRGSRNWKFIGGFNAEELRRHVLPGLELHRLLTRCRRRSTDVWRDHAASREHVRDPGAITLLDLQQRAPCNEDRETQTVHPQWPESTHQSDPGFLSGHSALLTLLPSAEAPVSRDDDAGPMHQPDPVFRDGHPATATLLPSVEAPTCLEDDAGSGSAGQRSKIAESAPQACYNLRKPYKEALCSQQD
ncbi:hypothetical protein HPB47_003698 [Ixodes persulcatus]|uniref:Uncharacterized protein n=1 Tax=Ixodes persulcatus TaxID=34615 RepID=A0AC60PJ54_IXOPE|nr:hypothetical protein HPB47_003698 [Ixodes persulcatus]